MTNKGDLRMQLQNKARNIPVVVGLLDGNAANTRGKDHLYADHSYFNRGWENNVFRIIRRGIHLTRVISHKVDRLKTRFGIEIQPYRKDGKHILVLAPGETIAKFYGKENIAEEMAAECRKYTDRPVIVRKKCFKANYPKFMEHLRDAWAVVSPFSVGGVEAAIAGYPVFSTQLCPSWPINAGPLENLDKPEFPERYEWANSLAWSSWHLKELGSIDYREYQCD